jgi:hypothetical protein
MPPTLASALIASLNDMFDASLVQRYAMEGHAPSETMLMLLGGAMLVVGALGYQMGLSGRRQLILSLLLLLMVSSAMALIIDFNRPRAGFTQINPAPLISGPSKASPPLRRGETAHEWHLERAWRFTPRSSDEGTWRASAHLPQSRHA